jgi:hypothetical protein
LILLEAIDRFGVQAIMGRDVLSYCEINRARYVENIINIHAARARSANWAEFVESNPGPAAILSEAENLANA